MLSKAIVSLKRYQTSQARCAIFVEPARLPPVERAVGETVQRFHKTSEWCHEDMVTRKSPATAAPMPEEPELLQRKDVAIYAALAVHGDGVGERTLRPLPVGLGKESSDEQPLRGRAE